MNEKCDRNILFYYIIGNSGGGSDNSLYYHLINLNKKKFNPIVIFKSKSNLVKNLQSMEILTIHQKFFSSSFKKTTGQLKLPGRQTVLFNLRVFVELVILIKYIFTYRVDILHINNNIKTNRAAAIAGLITRRKVIVHDRIIIKLGLFDKYLAKRIHKIITISDTVKAQYSKIKLKSDILCTIYNGIDTSVFNAKKNKKKESEIFIGSVGRLVGWKGVDILITSFAKIKIVYNNVKLLIVGDGIERQNLKDMVNNLGLQDSVTFYGNLVNVNEIYNKMDIFVHTALEPEPFGRVIIEAMACGLPVISTNIGGPTEIISDGKDGFLIEPGDERILAEKIIYLIENPDIIEKIGIQANLKAINNFDIKNTTKKIEELYRVI